MKFSTLSRVSFISPFRALQTYFSFFCEIAQNLVIQCGILFRIWFTKRDIFLHRGYKAEYFLHWGYYKGKFFFRIWVTKRNIMPHFGYKTEYYSAFALQIKIFFRIWVKKRNIIPPLGYKSKYFSAFGLQSGILFRIWVTNQTIFPHCFSLHLNLVLERQYTYLFFL